MSGQADLYLELSVILATAVLSSRERLREKLGLFLSETGEPVIYDRDDHTWLCEW